MSELLTLILVYDENQDNFFPLEQGSKPDPEKNTHLIIDETNKKITLSFTPNSTLIEKRTIERRVASFIKTGYEVPGSQGLRIGAGLPLEKVDPKSGELPDILLSHGHTFGKGKLVRDEVPDYVEKEDNYEVEKGSAGKKTDILGTNTQKVSGKPQLSNVMTQRLEEAFGKKGEMVEHKSVSADQETPKQKLKSEPKDGVTISSVDEHLFILGQFVDMYVQQGYQVLVYKNSNGKYEFKTIKEDSKYFIDGNQLFQG
jgi:hypothetical protein